MRKHKLVCHVIVACPKYLGKAVLGRRVRPPRQGTTGNGSLLLPWLVGARGGVSAAG